MKSLEVVFVNIGFNSLFWLLNRFIITDIDIAMRDPWIVSSVSMNIFNISILSNITSKNL